MPRTVLGNGPDGQRKVIGMKRWISSVALAAVLVSGFAASAASGGPTWTEKAPIPVGMAEVGVAELDGKVYAIGGTEQEPDLPPVFVSSLNMMYDPARDAWQARAPLPHASTHVGVAALDGKLYAIGGFANIVHMEPQDSAFVYDPQTDAWSALPGLSTPRGSVAVAAVGGKIHAFGGRESTQVVKVPLPPEQADLFEGDLFEGFGTVTTHEVFDPATRRWSEAAPVPGPARDHVGIAVLGGKVHLFGGRTADVVDNLGRHDVYDPATDTWASAAPLPRPRSSGAYTVLDGLIVYAGGECKPGSEPNTPSTDGDANTAYDDVSAYDPAGDRWVSLAPLPGARHAFGAATVGDTTYFVGGAPVCGGGTVTDTLALKL